MFSCFQSRGRTWQQFAINLDDWKSLQKQTNSPTIDSDEEITAINVKRLPILKFTVVLKPVEKVIFQQLES